MFINIYFLNTTENMSKQKAHITSRCCNICTKNFTKRRECNEPKSIYYFQTEGWAV